MIIDDEQLPFDAAWEEPLGDGDAVATRGGTVLPTLTIGKPYCWSAQSIMGAEWKPPVGNSQYILAGFSFSLRPLPRQTLTKTKLEIYLSTVGTGDNPTAFDLFPKTTMESFTGTRSVSFEPTFKFGDISVSAVKVGTTIKVVQSKPYVVVEGLQTSQPAWIFQAQPNHPIMGAERVYAVIEIPDKSLGVRASLYVETEVADTIFGFVRGFTTQGNKERRTFLLET